MVSCWGCCWRLKESKYGKSFSFLFHIFPFIFCWTYDIAEMNIETGYLIFEIKGLQMFGFFVDGVIVIIIIISLKYRENWGLFCSTILLNRLLAWVACNGRVPMPLSLYPSVPMPVPVSGYKENEWNFAPHHLIECIWEWYLIMYAIHKIYINRIMRGRGLFRTWLPSWLFSRDCISVAVRTDCLPACSLTHRLWILMLSK